MRRCWESTKILILLAVIAGTAVSTEAAQASAYQDWTGVWSTNRGELILRQDGRAVTGEYCTDNELFAQLAGTIDDEWGFSLRGNYAAGIETGAFAFRMTESNKRFQGWLTSPDNRWSGNRIDLAADSVRRQELTVVNNSPYAITALFVAPANSQDWQEVLGGEELACGRQKKAIFPLAGSSCGTWDIKIVDSSGQFTTFQNWRIQRDFTSLSYYFKNGSGTILFAVG